MIRPEQGLQGNLDPAALLPRGRSVPPRSCAMLEQVGDRRGYIANLGHGVLPHTPVDNVLAMIDAVHEWRAAN